MTVHKKYTVGGKEYEAFGYSKKRADGTIDRSIYSIYRGGEGLWAPIGEIGFRNWRRRHYRIVGWDSIVAVENQCKSLEGSSNRPGRGTRSAGCAQESN